MKHTATQQKTIQVPQLYRVVFGSVVVKWIVFMLFLSFLIQPVVSVHASEEVPVPDPEVKEESVEEERVEEIEPEEEVTEQVEETIVLEEESETNSSEEDLVVSEEGESDVEADIGNEEENNEDVSTPEEAVVVEEEGEKIGTEDDPSSQEVATSSLEDIQESAEEATEEIATSTEIDISSGTSSSEEIAQDDERNVDKNAATSTEEVATSSSSQEASDEENNEESATENTTPTEETSATSSNATSTEEVSEENRSVDVIKATTTNTSYVIHDQNKHQFGTDECVSVGDGSFYCSELEQGNEYLEDDIYAAPDQDGDMEIFIRLKGEQAQITHNITDDLAPYYDARSERIVWHSSKNDRFQIVSHDLKTKETTYLTDESYNNMEPVAYQDVTLWQAWIDNNWEIMMHKDGQTERLTRNTTHDIAPHMRGGHILWQTQFSDGFQIASYDMDTGAVEYIGEGTGARVENPRMVLVYDSTDENGDIRTVGYDFDSRSSFDLGHIPAELPDELPEPDQTGETRAIIQTKPGQREGESEEVDVLAKSTVAASGSATSTDTHTLDLRASSTQSVGSSTDDVLVSIPDVIVPPSDIKGHLTRNDVATDTDLVIPPLIGSSTDQTLPDAP